LYKEFQVWPLSIGEWFMSNVQDTEFDDEFLIDNVPHEVVVEAYNLDDTFEHVLWVAFSVLRGDPWSLLLGKQIGAEVL